METNIQFYHGTQLKDHWEEFTLAVKVPTKEELKLDVWKLLGDNIKEINVQVGISRVSKKDQYSRKLGRNLSKTRLTETLFRIESVLFEGDKKFVRLTTDKICLDLEIKDDRKKVFLVNAEI